MAEGQKPTSEELVAAIARLTAQSTRLRRAATRSIEQAEALRRRICELIREMYGAAGESHTLLGDIAKHGPPRQMPPGAQAPGATSSELPFIEDEPPLDRFG